MYFRSVLFFILIMVFSSCNYFQLQPNKQKNKFDPNEFFTTEAKTLTNKQVKIEKTVYKNNIVEVIKPDTVNWFSELKPFIDLEINKPAQINSYFIDTIINNEQIQINYVARDSSVKVKQINLVFKSNTLQQFKAISTVENLYYTSVDTIEYFMGGNYRISASSKPKLGTEISFVLKGKAIPF